MPPPPRLGATCNIEFETIAREGVHWLAGRPCTSWAVLCWAGMPQAVLLATGLETLGGFRLGPSLAGDSNTIRLVGGSRDSGLAEAHT